MTLKYPTIFAGHDAIRFVCGLYHCDRAMGLIGPHGIGKSQVIKDAAESLGIQYIALHLVARDIPDLVGLPRLEPERTVFIPPSVLPREGRGIISLEELNRAPQHVRQVALQLLLDRRLNDYALPPGWVPAVTMNPADSDYEVDLLDPATMSRVSWANLQSDREAWIMWAKAHKIHDSVIAYVEADTSAFDGAQGSPRNWTVVSDIVRHNKNAESSGTDRSISHLVQATVGVDFGLAFMSFLTAPDRPLSAAEVLKSSGALTIHKWLNDGRLDLVRGSFRNLLIHLQARTNYVKARSKPQWSHVAAFLAALPGDLREEARRFFDEHHRDFPDDRSDVV